MKHLSLILAALCVLSTVNGCAYKGKLRSPAQIAYDKEKKERAAAKEVERQEKVRQRQAEQAEEEQE